MVRLLLSIMVEQKRWLEAEAKRLGISQTEVIRRLIDAKMGR